MYPNQIVIVAEFTKRKIYTSSKMEAKFTSIDDDLENDEIDQTMMKLSKVLYVFCMCFVSPSYLNAVMTLLDTQ